MLISKRYKYRFIDLNNCTTLTQDVNNREKLCSEISGIWKLSVLYSLCNFSVNLKLLEKMCIKTLKNNPIHLWSIYFSILIYVSALKWSALSNKFHLTLISNLPDTSFYSAVTLMLVYPSLIVHFSLSTNPFKSEVFLN